MNGGVQLATPPWAEASVFAEPTGLGEGWDRLLSLDMPVGFLMGNDPRSTFGPDITSEMVWRPKKSSNEIVPDAGHLVSVDVVEITLWRYHRVLSTDYQIVQENPDAVADGLSRFLASIGGVVDGGRSKAKL
jgi:pimeloyl-ACP methyl ester carboxylesterase